MIIATEKNRLLIPIEKAYIAAIIFTQDRDERSEVYERERPEIELVDVSKDIKKFLLLFPVPGKYYRK